MGTEVDLFREEDLILNQLDQVGRLDRERELDRLVNVLNDVLVEYSTFPLSEIESIYGELKRGLEREYYKTEIINLSPTEMRVWHLSMFSSLKFLQKLLVNKGFDSPEQVVSKFNEILDRHFEEQLTIFSEKNGIDDLSNRLPDTEVLLESDVELLYMRSREVEREVTSTSKTQGWQTESRSGDQKSEVHM